MTRWSMVVALVAVVASGCDGSNDDASEASVTVSGSAPATTDVATAGTISVAGAPVSSDGSTPPSNDAPSPSSTATTVAATAATTTMATTGATSPVASAAVQPEGFELGPVQLTNADGTVCELCTWRALTSEQRGRGLMGVTDLGAADGMVFLYDAPSDGQFWMRGTPLPLDIAYFDGAGAFVSSASMTPCLTGPDASCARYPATAPYVLALEVPAGRLAELGIGPGSVAVLDAGTGCDTP